MGDAERGKTRNKMANQNSLLDQDRSFWSFFKSRSSDTAKEQGCGFGSGMDI